MKLGKPLLDAYVKHKQNVASATLLLLYLLESLMCSYMGELKEPQQGVFACFSPLTANM